MVDLPFFQQSNYQMATSSGWVALTSKEFHCMNNSIIYSHVCAQTSGPRNHKYVSTNMHESSPPPHPTSSMNSAKNCTHMGWWPTFHNFCQRRFLHLNISPVSQCLSLWVSFHKRHSTLLTILNAMTPSNSQPTHVILFSNSVHILRGLLL